MPTKSFHRTDRVSAQLRRELGTLVHEAVREHGLPSASVSDVEVTRDMAHAKVFVTALMQERSAEAVKGLKELAWGLRMELARRVKMRHVPELHFHYDESVDRGHGTVSFPVAGAGWVWARGLGRIAPSGPGLHSGLSRAA